MFSNSDKSSYLRFVSGAMFIMVWFVSVVSAQDIRSGDIVIVLHDGADLRLNRETNVRLPKGTEFRVVEVKNDWIGAHLDLNGKGYSGWVQKDHVSVQRKYRNERVKPVKGVPFEEKWSLGVYSGTRRDISLLPWDYDKGTHREPKLKGWSRTWYIVSGLQGKFVALEVFNIEASIDSPFVDPVIVYYDGNIRIRGSLDFILDGNVRINGMPLDFDGKHISSAEDVHSKEKVIKIDGRAFDIDNDRIQADIVTRILQEYDPKTERRRFTAISSSISGKDGFLSSDFNPLNSDPKFNLWMSDFEQRISLGNTANGKYFVWEVRTYVKNSKGEILFVWDEPQYSKRIEYADEGGILRFSVLNDQFTVIYYDKDLDETHRDSYIVPKGMFVRDSKGYMPDPNQVRTTRFLKRTCVVGETGRKTMGKNVIRDREHVLLEQEFVRLDDGQFVRKIPHDATDLPAPFTDTEMSIIDEYSITMTKEESHLRERLLNEAKCTQKLLFLGPADLLMGSAVYLSNQYEIDCLDSLIEKLEAKEERDETLIARLKTRRDHIQKNSQDAAKITIMNRPFEESREHVKDVKVYLTKEPKLSFDDNGTLTIQRDNAGRLLRLEEILLTAEGGYTEVIQ